MIDEQRITILLAAFYDGKTTPTEEAELRTFFLSENIPEKWTADRKLFLALYRSAPVPLPDGLTQRLEQALDKHIQSAGKTNVRLKESPFRKKIIGALSIAAIVLALIGIFIFRKQSLPAGKRLHARSEIQNIDQAAEIAEKYLTMVSVKMNMGLKPLEKMNDGINKPNEILNKNLKLN